MAARYTYFRTPEGRPYRGTDGKHAPTDLLAKFGKTASANPDGTVSWVGFFLKRFEPALRAAVTVIDSAGSELNEDDSWRIIWQGLVDAAKQAPGKPIKPHDLLAAADRAAATFFRSPVEHYIVISSLSVADLPAKRITLRGCTISSLKRRGMRFPLPRVVHIPDARSYRLVKIATQGRSMFQAVDNAVAALNLLRGLWSLFATYGAWRMSFGAGSRKPLGVIHAGPIHTLHFPDGRLVDDNLFWYEPDFVKEQPLFKHPEEWRQIEKNRRWATKRLAAVEYGPDLEALLIRYVGALDQSNPDLAFLQMWGILERLTDTVGANYDETIKRAVWPYIAEDRPMMKNVLESLRHRRNQYVHSGRASQDDQVAYLIKFFVDPHLLKLLANPFKVRSLKEYGEFLSLPTDLPTLRERQRRIALALRALGGEDGSEK